MFQLFSKATHRINEILTIHTNFAVFWYIFVISLSFAMSEASVVSSPPELPLSEEKTGSLRRWQRVG